MTHGELSTLQRAYVRTRQWFQPYYRYWPKQTHKRDSTPQKPVQSPIKKSRTTDSGSRTKAAIVRMYDSDKPLTRLMREKVRPDENCIYFFHDDRRLQVVGHFPPKAGQRFSERDNAARRTLEPIIYPRQDKPFDRTHLIPIGFHGSENDERLLIGWDSDQNRNLLNQFESKQKRIQEAIYWVTLINRTGTGARFRYLIYSVSSGELLDQLDTSMQAQFVWRI